MGFFEPDLLAAPRIMGATTPVVMTPVEKARRESCFACMPMSLYQNLLVAKPSPLWPDFQAARSSLSGIGAYPQVPALWQLKATYADSSAEPRKRLAAVSGGMPEDVVLEAGLSGLRAGSAGFGLAMVGSIGRADSVSWAGGLGSTGNCGSGGGVGRRSRGRVSARLLT